MWGRFGSLLLAATVLALAGTGQLARAQDEPELEQAEEPPLQRVYTITDEQFDRVLFGARRDRDTARSLLESRLKSRIESLNRLYGITKDERKKLELAGRGDIKRFFDRVEETRKQLQLATTDRIQFSRAVEELHALSRHYESGIFHEESMSSKTLKKILRQNPGIPTEKDRGGKRIRLYQSRVEWVVLTLQKSLFLSDPQRHQLLTLFLEETHPPRRFGPYDYHGIILQASALPEAKLKPIFDDTQWRALLREFEGAKRMKQSLQDEGYLPGERTPGTQPAVAKGEAEQEPAEPKTGGEAPRG